MSQVIVRKVGYRQNFEHDKPAKDDGEITITASDRNTDRDGNQILLFTLGFPPIVATEGGSRLKLYEDEAERLAGALLELLSISKAQKLSEK